MTWARKHLNLLLLFLWLAWFVLALIFTVAQLPGLFDIINVIGILVLFIASGWVIRQKRRSLWWLLLWPIFTLLVPWLLQSKEQLEEDDKLIESISGKIGPSDKQ